MQDVLLMLGALRGQLAMLSMLEQDVHSQGV